METKRRGRPRKNAHPESVENGTTFPNNGRIDEIIDATNFDFTPEGATPEISGYNPLGDSPIHRDYSSPNVDQAISQDLDEPTFQKSTFSQAEQEKQNIIKSTSSDAQDFAPKTEGDVSNPALNDLDDKDKKFAAEQLVEAALDTYDTLWSLAGNMIKVSDKKIKQLVKDGKLDPQQKIPIDEKTEVTAIEFIQSYNAQVPDAVSPDPAFRKKVYQPLSRIFQKRGWGMTDEQTVLFAVLKDSATKGMSAWALKKSINEVLEHLEEQTQMLREKTSKEETYEAEELTDEDLEYERRMAELKRQQTRKTNARPRKNKKQSSENQYSQKMNINFEDNPLRTPVPDDYPMPKVEEKFEKGQVID